jgi:predicted RNA-binding protein YlxR (DUF448 family)
MSDPGARTAGRRARAAAAVGPVRTCVGCGARAQQAELRRLRVETGQVVVDAARSGGRGAWLHPAEACLERAARRRAFGRALRAPGARVDPATLWDLLTGSARKD